MWAFLKKELRSYFSTLTGYVFVGAFLMILGIYTTAINLYSAYPTFEYTLSSSLLLLVLLIPVLTMRLFAEERQRGITPLLSSLPVSATKQVLAKFFSAAAVFSIPMLVICFYPLLLSAFGEVDFTTAYLSIFGYWLLGLALLAIGMFLSSLAPTSTFAAVLSVGIFLLLYLSSGIADLVPVTAFASFACFAILLLCLSGLLWYLTHSWLISGIFCLLSETVLLICYLVLKDAFVGTFADLVAWFSLFFRYYSFVNGIFDWADIFYYLSLCATGIFFTVLSVEKKRWS